MTFASSQHWAVYDARGRRKYPTARERRRILAEAERRRPEGRALLHTLVLTGCRISEALALMPDHLDAERDTLTFRTLKRRRLVFRTLPIPRELTAMLLALGRATGEPFWSMHRSTAWRLVHGVMATAGVRGPQASCKGLRHGFGIHAAQRNVPPNLIQRWMGHASPTTTAIYLDAVGPEERGFASRMW